MSFFYYSYGYYSLRIETSITNKHLACNNSKSFGSWQYLRLGSPNIISSELLKPRVS